MAIQLNGDATGDYISGSNGGIIHFGIDGTITIITAAGKAVVWQDSAGNVTGSTDSTSRQMRVVKVPVAAVDTAGGALAWQNPEAVAVIVDKVEVDVTTVSTGAGTIEIGETPTNATTASANLIDTLDVHSAVGLFDNITDIGAGGKSRVKVPVGKWITGSKASGTLVGLVANVYIHYHLV